MVECSVCGSQKILNKTRIGNHGKWVSICERCGHFVEMKKVRRIAIL
jgi:hypothetical protein